MKGLIRNNFYMLGGSLTAVLITCLVGVILSAVAGIFTDNSIIISGIIGMQLGAFGGLSGTAIQKDSVSRWNRFELTMPLCRTDVIKAKYISYLMYVAIGVLFSLASILMVYLTSGGINLERVGIGYTFGLGFALCIPAILTPLALILGSDKNETLMFISMIISIGLFLGYTTLIYQLLGNVPDINLILRGSYLVLCALIYLSSFILSLCIYRKKEI